MANYVEIAKEKETKIFFQNEKNVKNKNRTHGIKSNGMEGKRTLKNEKEQNRRLLNSSLFFEDFFIFRNGSYFSIF